MDCVSQLWSIVPCLWDCSAKHAAFICDLQQNMETLSTEIGKLQSLYQDLKSKVEAEEARPMMRRTEEVNNWLERTHAMVEKVTKLEQKVDRQVKKKCAGIGCCPKNCRSSYKLGKEVIEKLSETRRLVEEGRAFNVVARRLPPPAVDELPMETTVGLDAKFKEAWTCLQDKRVGVMGLYGTGGVGKTTLLKKINNEFLEVNSNHKLDVVIWILVSKPLDLGRVQEAIRAKLCIPDELWDNKSEDLRAAEILKVLKLKKFVLMLDDLWESFELYKIGVPRPNESNMCKVVFTTRSEEVCRRMDAHESIRVDCLPANEAFNLFYAKVGEDTLKSHRDIPNLAKAVAAECRGLPLALITTGGAMAGRRNPQEWRHAITTLQSYPATFSDMRDSVLRVLRYSYDSLENDAHKSCFVYCSLFPEDYSIVEESLIEHWLGEGFLGEHNSIGEARAQGEYIISSLKRACLLEYDADRLTVRMHDVIRDMALWVSDNKHVVQVGDKWTEISRWSTAQRIALWNYTGVRLTEVPECPNLITLFIRSTKLEELPNEFMESMKKLRVLDLSRNKRLDKLQKGICGLTNLHYLNLEETCIHELPIEVAQLKNLRYLWVSCEKIPKKVMESLSSLQVFHKHISSSGKDMSESESTSSEREILEGVICLEQLTDLCIQIHHASNVRVLEESPKLQGCLRTLYLHEVDNLASFTIIGTWDRFEYLTIYDCEKLEEVKIEVRKDKTSKMQYSNSDHYYGLSDHDVKLHHLYIGECPRIRNLTSLIYASNLQVLVLLNCESMEEIISERYSYKEEEGSDFGIFSSLTYLKLEDLPSLRSICPHTLLFPCLEVIEVEDCPNLKKLPFDSSTANRAFSKKIKIKGEEDWWNNLVWENEATKQLFAPHFNPT